MSTQAECVKVIQTETERLKQYLAALPQDAWTKPSACALWEIRDVVAHLIHATHLYTENITRGRQDDISTPQGRPEPTIFKTVTQEERRQRAAVAAQTLIVFREGFGNNLLSTFGQAWDQFHHLAASLSPHEWNKPCYHTFPRI